MLDITSRRTLRSHIDAAHTARAQAWAHFFNALLHRH
jgi:hypothetical protein